MNTSLLVYHAVPVRDISFLIFLTLKLLKLLKRFLPFLVWKGDVYRLYRAFGGAKAAFLAEVFVDQGLAFPEQYGTGRTHFPARRASCACFIVDNGDHQSTIPKRYPS